MSSFVQEFKEFALKGSAIDMAVGIILGAAFNRVVNSIVNDLLMPPIGLVIGGVNFSDLNITIKQAAIDAAGTKIPAIAIRYGAFINTFIEFLIVALTVFFVVKVMNRLVRGRESALVDWTKPKAP